jgi:hypothetical protein
MRTAKRSAFNKDAEAPIRNVHCVVGDLFKIVPADAESKTERIVGKAWLAEESTRTPHHQTQEVQQPELERQTRSPINRSSINHRPQGKSKPVIATRTMWIGHLYEPYQRRRKMDTQLSPVERLAQTHPDLEIWWDSSPLVYKSWVQKMLNAAAPRRRPDREAQFALLYNPENPWPRLSGYDESTLFVEAGAIRILE